MKVDGSKAFVVSGDVILGEVIGYVSFARRPVILELVLRLGISEPVEAHVHGLCFLLFNGTAGDAICSAVAGANRRGRLGMAEFNESEAKRDGESCI